jgi:hypothetical protein
MIQVTFNYDPETNTVSGVSSSTVEAQPKAKSIPAVKAKSKSSKITLNGSSLQLTQDALDALGSTIGDRICVRFNPNLVLVRPEIAKEPKGGNLITKSLTISVRGKAGEAISKLGTEFNYTLKSDGYLNLSTDSTTEPTAEAVEFTDVDLTVEDKPVNEISVTTIDDSDFLADIEDGEEIDFTIDI